MTSLEFIKVYEVELYLKKKSFFKFIIKQQKMLTDEIKEAIKEQTRLSKIAHEMQDKRDALEERSKNLIVLGFTKLKEKYPDIESKLRLL